MSIEWTVLGTFGQLLLAVLLFMLVAFSGGGLANGHRLGRAAMKVLDASLFVLPGTCVLSTLIVWYLQWAGGGTDSYGWFALPLAATALYFAFFQALIRRLGRAR